MIINTVKNLTYSFPIPDLLNDKLSQLREKIGESLQRDATQEQNGNNVIFIYTVTADSNDDILIISDLIRKSVKNGEFTAYLRKSGNDRFLNAKVNSEFLMIDHSSSSSLSSDSNFNFNFNMGNLNSDSNMNMRRENIEIGTTSTATSTSSYDTSPFCLPFVNGNIAYPFFTHYGPAGTNDSFNQYTYNQFTPESCDCDYPIGDPTGNSPW